MARSKGITKGVSAVQRSARRKRAERKEAERAAKRTAQKRERGSSLKKQYSDAAAKRKEKIAIDKSKRDATTVQRKEKIAADEQKQKLLGRAKNRVKELERAAAQKVGVTVRRKPKGTRPSKKQPVAVRKRGRKVMYGTPAAGVGAAYLLSGSDKPKPPATSQELSFAQALKGAKDGGQKTFTWKGSKYSTTKTGRGGRGARGRQKVLPGFRPFGGVIAKALLGKDEAFGGDKGLIDFVRLGPQKKRGGGMANKKGYVNGGVARRSNPRGVGAAKRGYGKAMR